ncbi:hypothetical protein SG34_010585 [Thalassomonas viridans]|uniref:Uncharacterized protein n=1 Tax=Thalassomonas viridans TaxID=137584 RepID=A0AAE9Z904_9GAMM|nr:hypothetical protein [Thalassomonas viridans]WDE07292.1 hypothetical protein SG34_010585 [Thalassomonas viridans]
MALIFSQAVAGEDKTTWQNVSVQVPLENGSRKMSFKAKFVVPDQETYTETTQSHTVDECLKMWWVDAKGIQASPEDPKEMEFNDSLRDRILATTWLKMALFEAHQQVMAKGKL